MKELRFEDLSIRQKLGMTYTAFLRCGADSKEEDDFVINLIKEHALGCVWIQFNNTGCDPEEAMRRVKEAADYPILIVTDAESGIGEYTIGNHGSIGRTGSEEHAYAFGKATAVTARKMGYNLVCNPLLDMKPGESRSLGGDKYAVTKLAAAVARGMHDGGVLTLGKHYPSGTNAFGIDPHMAESVSYETKEDLIENNLYPYIQLNNMGLLDGIMSAHMRFDNIDPDRPASLSRKVMDIIREQGFEGIVMTDALCMMGIKAKFGDVQSKGMAIAAGNDLILPYSAFNKQTFEEHCQAYDEGIIPDDILDEAVKRVLEAQHKTMELPKDGELTEDEIQLFRNISMDGVYAKTDDGVTPEISRDGRHFFAVMLPNPTSVGMDGKPDVDTFSGGWYSKDAIEAKIKELFPNSDIGYFSEFPSQMNNLNILERTFGYDELIFVTFSQYQAYMGDEHLTRRLEILINAMQYTDRITGLVHFGNPYVLNNLSHIRRYIVGSTSADSIDACFEVLGGRYPAKGTLNCDAKLN